MKTWHEADIAAYKPLRHVDWEFNLYSSDNFMRSGHISDEQMKGMMTSNKNENLRCLYENDDILITHSFTTFASGDREAILMVHRKKDGLLWRTETGATPM